MRRLLLSCLAVAACLCAPATAGAQSGAPALEPVGGTFASPVHVTAPPGDGHRLMVVERGGSVQVVRDGQTLSTPFLTIDSDFTSGGERGLLSIAFDPQYERNRLLYAFYTDAQGDIRVDEFRRAADSRDRAEPGYRRPVIEIPHSAQSNHNGGQLQFGPDGHLYLGTGDGGGGYDPYDNGQRVQPLTGGEGNGPHPLLGKILRIDPTPGGGYRIPFGNPFARAGDSRVDEIWAYGLRNPFRFSFDDRTGAMAIGDVGQARVEEIDYAAPVFGFRAARGFNFGWDACEGTRATYDPATVPDPAPSCKLPGHRRPIVEHLQADGYCSIIGGYVVRDPRVEALNGRYLYGDLCYGVLRSFDPSSPADDRREEGLPVNSVVSFGEDACGRVYTVELGGRVSRLVDDSPSACALEPGLGSGGGGPARVEVALAGSRRQRALRRGAVLVRVRCDSRCGMRALGRLSLRVRGRNRKLRQARVRLPRAGRVTLRLRLTRSSRRAVRRALARDRRVRARLTIRVRGADRRLVVKRRLIRIVR